MQCDHHDSFRQIALAFDWMLWEDGIDITCEHFPKLVPIWLRPCPWDLEQREPIGCLCCTNLNRALSQFHQDMRSWAESRFHEAELIRAELNLDERVQVDFGTSHDAADALLRVRRLQSLGPAATLPSARRLRSYRHLNELEPERGEPLGPAPDFLQPYQAR